MKKLILVIFTIFLFAISLFAQTVYNMNESEGNSTPPTADLVPIGTNVVNLFGVTGDDDDWFNYCVFLVHHWDTIQVTITDATNGPALYVDVCTEDPGVVQHVLNGIGDSFTYIVANEANHYIRVYSTVPANSYEVTIYNAEEETLPVVLSSFTGEFNNGLVGLKWITQSETDLSGYNVLRNENNTLETALMVNGGIISPTNSSTEHLYTYQDQETETNHEYYYWLESVNRDGTVEHYGPVTVSTTTSGGNTTPEIVEVTGMDSAYPNPFGTETNVKFRLSNDMNVKLDIYNLKGQKIRSLYNGELSKGVHSYKWDGKNSNGKSISSGLYFGRLTTPTGVFNSKLYLFK